MDIKRTLHYPFCLICIWVLSCSYNPVYYGVKVVVRNEEQTPLYVVISAWYDDGRKMWKQGSGCSNGCLITRPISPNGQRITLYCGTNPDFRHLLVQVTIWELVNPDSGLEKLPGKKAAFVVLLRRPEFDYAKEEFIYTDYAVVERHKGGGFKLLEPDIHDQITSTSQTVIIQEPNPDSGKASAPR